MLVENETMEEKQSETKQPAEQVSLEIQAALFLHKALPAFKSQLDLVTGVQAKSVLYALAESPLEKKISGFTTKEAQQLFELGLIITNAKFILFNVALNDKEIANSVEEEAKKAGAEAAGVSVTETVENKGE
jgi:hypothetical protein